MGVSSTGPCYIQPAGVWADHFAPTRRGPSTRGLHDHWASSNLDHGWNGRESFAPFKVPFLPPSANRVGLEHLHCPDYGVCTDECWVKLRQHKRTSDQSLSSEMSQLAHEKARSAYTRPNTHQHESGLMANPRYPKEEPDMPLALRLRLEMGSPHGMPPHHGPNGEIRERVNASSESVRVKAKDCGISF